MNQSQSIVSLPHSTVNFRDLRPVQDLISRLRERPKIRPEPQLSHIPFFIRQTR